MDRRRNVLICPNCGFSILSESYERQCTKCDTQMILDKNDKK